MTQKLDKAKVLHTMDKGAETFKAQGRLEMAGFCIAFANLVRRGFFDAAEEEACPIFLVVDASDFEDTEDHTDVDEPIPYTLAGSSVTD